MPNFLVIGLVLVVPIVALGTALIHHWASVQWRREEPIRHRQAVLDRLFEAVDQALDPEPSVSFVGVQEIDALRDAQLLEPADDDFVEEIAKVVVTTRLDESADDQSYVVGPVSADADVPPERVVQPSEVLAAKILIEIAEAKSERPSPLAQRIAGAAVGLTTEQPAAATKKPTTVSLKRTA